MVKFENIEIKYGDFVAIENLNLDIKEGEFFTFLGPVSYTHLRAQRRTPISYAVFCLKKKKKKKQ